MPLNPSYYVSTIDQGSRDGSLGNPYLLSDLSIVGGTNKTVSTGERVAFLADGTYTPGAAPQLTAGALFRGAPVTGGWDETGATKTAWTLNASQDIALLATDTTIADMHITRSSGSSSMVSMGNQTMAYRVKFSVGAGFFGKSIPSNLRLRNRWRAVVSVTATRRHRGVLQSGVCGSSRNIWQLSQRHHIRIQRTHRLRHCCRRRNGADRR